MIRFMLDSDKLDDLTGHAGILGTYSDLVTDLPALRRRFPASEIVLFDRGLGDPTGEASIFDIEPGALTIDKAVQRFDEQHSRGIPFLTTYCDRTDVDAVRERFGFRDPWRMIATLDGTAHIGELRALHDPAVIQCLSAAELGMHGDGSLVFNDGWHPVPAPINRRTLRSDVVQAQTQAAILAGDLHRMAALLGG